MKSIAKLAFRTTTLAAFTSAAAAPLALGQGAAVAGAQLVQVQGGTVTFKVDTNLPAINVHGKSKALSGEVYVRDGSDGVVLEQLKASVPVESLGTGIGLRDRHMRKHVFTTSDGRVPDLEFAADSARCSPRAGRESTCQVSGRLMLRGVARPFTIALKVNDDGGKVRASGDGQVKLSAYGIERPSNLGVQTADDVVLHLEFTATRPVGQPAVASGARH